MKKVLCITGTRADFGKLKPLLNHLEQHNDIELHLVITGMHLMKIYGSTYLEVLRENYRHYYLFSNQMQGEPMGAVLGNTITFLSRLSAEIEPNMILIHGDRLEALAGATVGLFSNCLVCHIEGGELSGTIDDAIRHAVSKLSHIHLVANQGAVNRLIQMGENPQNIHIIGSPDLDIMLQDELPILSQVKEHYAIPFDKYGISLFHPVTTENEYMHLYAEQYFQALVDSGQNIIAIYPNNDTGTEHILKVLKQIHSERFRVFPSIRFEAFLTLLKHAHFMIGNSSAGIREAPLYGIPTIDVGTRQNNRYRGPSIFHCGYETSDIIRTLNRALSVPSFYPDTAFSGNSNQTSTECFARIISCDDTWNTNIQKKFIDLP